jgi:aminoglycoside phosphotransferase (APT) family kinase protein
MAQQFPWRTEFDLSLAAVRAALNGSGLPVDLDTIERLGEGFDYVSYSAGVGAARWVFRFAKRPDTARALAREAALLARLSTFLPSGSIKVPAYQHCTAGDRADVKDAPLAFGAYPLLPGRALWDHEPASLDPGVLGRQLGTWLHHVHAFVPERPPLRTPDHFGAALPEFHAHARELAPHLPDGMEPVLLQLLAKPVPPPSGPPRFCHADLGAEHLLVDADRACITAVIDWGDACWEDPLADLVGLWAWGGDAAATAAFQAYGIDPSRSDWYRLRLRGICYAVGTLHFGVFGARTREREIGRAMLERMGAGGLLTDPGRRVP